ncbi:hypothetical protein [Pedobacter deserti]|uniref:hypothetical protein n=1 Tax=Pedobacter deserti TaxID=2817382 RepID=UPI00210A7A90|nr:hypothetical protein [Pedobacter sp. SYSU D00382]
MNKFYSLIALLLLPLSFILNTTSTQAQTPENYKTFGNGAAKIVTRTYQAGEKLTLETRSNAFDPFGKTYLIKDKLVLSQNELELKGGKLVKRNDDVKTDTTMSGSNVHIAEVKTSSVKYLIDWESKMTMIYAGNAKNDTIYRLPLKASSDICYKMLALANWLPEVRLSGDNKEKIAGYVCSTGKAIDKNGEEVTFYYTTDSIGLVSPLNGLVSPKEKINIMAFFGQLQTDGEAGKSYILFKIDDLVEMTIDDELFKIPEPAPVKDVSSMQEYLNQRMRSKSY